MKKFTYIFLVISCAFQNYLSAQQLPEKQTDSLHIKKLEEVIVIGKFDYTQSQHKMLSSLDGYLETNSSINMLKRGAYAWEPLINGMATERSVITIDGMRIYGACTDKMDPITSYVEITNLSKANVRSGQSGAEFGATIAGSLDLVRNRSSFSNSGFKGSLLSGWESNNSQKILGSKLQYANTSFFTDIDFMLRDANNYKAGGNKEVLYSQFSKYNVSATAGLKLSDHESITAALIFDDAYDIGYPALPMDVSSAKATIASLEFVRHHLSPNIHQWESKVYYNKVSHLMDDSKRPMVPVRMDMPGWSNTVGFYSRLTGEHRKHQWKVNVAGHYNNSLAEMTMYSNNPAEKDMFMLTWPGVATYFTSIFLANKAQWNEKWTSNFTLSSSLHHNTVNNSFGLESLRIFYPSMAKANFRLLGSAGADLVYQQSNWINQVGIGLGNRAPSVSEGYGFYLFNSMDSFDYIGNPEMQTEKSLTLTTSSTFGFTNGFVKAQLSYFKLFDYILAQPDPLLLPMTIGAKGIKRYKQMAQADVINANLSTEYAVTKLLRMTAKVTYRYGRAAEFKLPQVQPFSYGVAANYQRETFGAEVNLDGALRQNRFSANFGETPANPYMVVNMALTKQFHLAKQRIVVKTGIENIFDKAYRTFADWNNIPRMGRNFYLNLVYKF